MNRKPYLVARLTCEYGSTGWTRLICATCASGSPASLCGVDGCVRCGWLAGGDERPAEGEVADSVQSVEALCIDLAALRQEPASEARARPRRMDLPRRIAGVREQAQRRIAAKVEIEVDRHRLAGEPAGIDPREEATSAAASSARLQAKRPAVDIDAGIGAEAAGIAEPEAQLGFAQVHLRRIDAGAGEVGWESEPRVTGDLCVVDDGFVDRPLADFGPHVGRIIHCFGRKRQLAPHLVGPGDLLPVFDHRLTNRRAIGDDQDRSIDQLLAAPALGD